MRRIISAGIVFFIIIILSWDDHALSQCRSLNFSLPNNSQAGNSVAGNIIAADFNLDGSTDLITIGNFTDEDVISMMPGNGDGTFGMPQKVLAASEGAILDHSPLSGLTSDFNSDGIPDLLIVNFRPASYQIYLGNGDGSFRLQTKFFVRVDEQMKPAIPSIGDLNNDGIIDILAAAGPTISRKNGTLETFFGNGDGTFLSGPTYDPYPQNSTFATTIGTVIGVADVNGDGRNDIVLSTRQLATNSQWNRIIIVQIDGNFNFSDDNATSVSLNSVNYLLDLNHDGRVDLLNYLPNSRIVTVELGRGNGTFEPPAPTYLKGAAGAILLAAIADFNDDSYLDLAFAATTAESKGRSKIAIYTGSGNAAFNRKTDAKFLLNSEATKFIVADFNGNGRIDIATYSDSNHSDSRLISIYLNRCGN